MKEETGVMKFIVTISIVALVSLGLVDDSSGHGMMLSPPGRSSRWRYDNTAPTNYNDNANYCGGYGVCTARERDKESSQKQFVINFPIRIGPLWRKWWKMWLVR